MLSILWTILIGFIAGVIAKFVTPGSTHEPQGFILTTALGIVGALVATYLGQAVGWYQAGQGAGFIASIVGAALILLVWGFIASRPRNRTASVGVPSTSSVVRARGCLARPAILSCAHVSLDGSRASAQGHQDTIHGP